MSKYGTFEDLWREVEQRFVEDGMYLPPESKEVVQEQWQQTQPAEVQDADTSLTDFIVPQTPEDDILMPVPSQDFFIGMDRPQPSQPLPEILRPVQPSSPLTESFSRISDPFKSIGKTFKSAFKRLFGR